MIMADKHKLQRETEKQTATNEIELSIDIIHKLIK